MSLKHYKHVKFTVKYTTNIIQSQFVKSLFLKKVNKHNSPWHTTNCQQTYAALKKLTN